MFDNYRFYYRKSNKKGSKSNFKKPYPKYISIKLKNGNYHINYEKSI